MADFNVLVTFFFAIASVTCERYPNVNTEVLTGNDAKDFTALLKNLIKVNDGRMKNLKWMSNSLQKPAYTLDKILRTGMNEYRPRKRPDVAAFFVLPQTQHIANIDVFYKENQKSSPTQTKAHLKNNLENNSYILRSSCNRRAINKCKKVCKKSISRICETYYCKSKLKKYLKKECKKNCKYEFGSDRW